MRFLLALFDQSTRNPANRYWTWFNPELPMSLLSSAYDGIISANLPERPQDLGPNDIHGGLASLDGWLCCYRVVNGGLDSFGREGRFVPICAFVRLSDAHDRNCIGVLDSRRIQQLALTARHSCPVAAPTNLDIESATPKAMNVSDAVEELRRTGHLSLSTPEALALAGSVVAALVPDCAFQCKVLRNAKNTYATITTHAVAAAPVVVPPVRSPPEKARGIFTGAGNSSHHRVIGSVESAPEEVPKPHGYSPRKVYLWLIGTGIICLSLGSFVGFKLQPKKIPEQPPVVPQIEFVVRQGEGQQSRGRDGTTLELEIAPRTPRTLKIDRWTVDEDIQAESAARLKTVLTDGTHRVEAQFRYRDQDGRENAGKVMATVKIDQSGLWNSKVEVHPEQYVR